MDSPDFVHKLKHIMDGVEEGKKTHMKQMEDDAAEYPNIALMGQLSSYIAEALKIPKEVNCKNTNSNIL